MVEVETIKPLLKSLIRDFKNPKIKYIGKETLRNGREINRYQIKIGQFEAGLWERDIDEMLNKTKKRGEELERELKKYL